MVRRLFWRQRNNHEMPCLELLAFSLGRLRSGSRPFGLDGAPRGCRRLWVGRLPARISDEPWKCSLQPGAPPRRRLELLSGAQIMVCLMGAAPTFDLLQARPFFFPESGITPSGCRYTRINPSNLTKAASHGTFCLREWPDLRTRARGRGERRECAERRVQRRRRAPAWRAARALLARTVQSDGSPAPRCGVQPRALAVRPG